MEVTNYTEALKLLYPNTFIPVSSNMTQDALINYVFMNPPDSFNKLMNFGRKVRWSDGKLWFTQGEEEEWFRVFDKETGNVKITVIQSFLEWVKEEEKLYFDSYVSRIFSIKLKTDITSFAELREEFVTCKRDTILSNTITERGWSSLTYRFGQRIDVHGIMVIDCVDPKEWAEELINYQTMITKAIELHKRFGASGASLTSKGVITLCGNAFIVTAETDVEDAFNGINKVCEYLEVIKKATLQPSSALKLTQGYGLAWRDLYWPDLRREDPASVAEQINDKLNEFLEKTKKKVISQQIVPLAVEAETISETKTVLQKTWNNAHYGANITAAGTANKAAVDLLLPFLGDKQKAAVQFIGPMLVQWAALRVKNEQISNILSAAADFAQIHLGTQLVEATFNLVEKQVTTSNDLLLTEDTLQDIEHIHIKEGVKVK